MQLPDFYCQVIINYTYVHIHNKHCNQFGLLLVLFKYTLQAVNAYAVCKIHDSMLNSRTKVLFSAP